jgi:hypothetical protein
MMKIVKLLIGVCALVIPAATDAQDPPQPATECAAGVAAPYLRCALWIDGSRVRRGAEGVVIAQPGFFRPLRFARHVQGDSAVHYARSFERNAGRAGGFAALSAAFLVAAYIVADNYDCEPQSVFGLCTNSDDDEALTVGLLAGGALVSAIISGVFQRRATHAAGRSILWHNANFAR